MSPDNSAQLFSQNENFGTKSNTSPKNDSYIYYFYVIYNKEGVEMVSLRKNFVEDQNVALSNMVLNYPGFTLRTIEVDYRRFAEDSNNPA